MFSDNIRLPPLVRFNCGTEIPNVRKTAMECSVCTSSDPKQGTFTNKKRPPKNTAIII